MESRTPGEQPGSDRQWWLTAGSEICSVCEADVHPEALGFCMICDQGVCSSCFEVSEPNEPVLCAACAGAAGKEEG